MNSDTLPAPAPVLHDAPINILIVDDERTNIHKLESVLADPRYRILRADSADKALLALTVEEFALVILDIRMHGMRGVDLAHMIKELKKTAPVPIIFLSAYYSEDKHVLEGYDAGAVDYLHKPVDPVILRSKVAAFAELHSRQRESAMANRALLTEVSERRRAEEQLRVLNETLEQRVSERTEALRDANRLKDEFLAMLGHELRNPLAAIANAVQMLQDVGGEPGTAEWAVGILKRQSGHLSRIADDLLDVARITRGRVELRTQAMDLNLIIGRAVETARPFIEDKHHDLGITLAAGGLRVEADPTRLEQCIVNLLVNAAKYTPEGGRITIAEQRLGAEAVITVRDNGIGIAPDMLAGIFDLFAKADHSLHRSEGGLGIGLNICRQLIELHGGTVSAQSDGPGDGAEFTIRLPALSKPETVSAPPAPTPAPRATSSDAAPRRVLVVDDNLDAARTLARLLNRRGHEVCTAYDGPGAVKAAEDFKPNVLLLDLGLPGIDGYELARRFRADGFADALIIAISGYAQKSDVENSHAAGFDQHFAKPLDFAELVAAIQAGSR